MEYPTDSLPESGRLLQLLAYVYLENYRPDKAVVLLQAIDALRLADDRALAMLALALRRANQPELALQTLDRLTPESADDALAAVLHLIRAQSLHALDRLDDAHVSMRAYVALRSRLSGTDHREPI